MSKKKEKDSEFDAQANLLVKNLPESMTQNDLNQLFSKHGTIASCKLETTHDNKSRMFGYVQFDKAEAATAAIAALNGSKVEDKEIQVTVLTKRNDREEVQDQFSNLYVFNLPENLNEEQFKAIFAPIGEIQ